MFGRRLLVPVLAVGLLAVAADANAGSLVLRDEAQIFTPGDIEQLRGIVARAPFDARLVTTTNYADQPGFSRFVGTLVSEPDMVVVGIDPQHHHVQVHFGTASHIPDADWSAIERAGNDAFKRGAWEEGGADIFRAATTAVSSTGRSTTPVTTPASSSAGSLLGVGLIVMLVFGVGLAAVVFSLLRRRSSGYGAGGYGGGPYPGGYPGGQGPYYGPGGAPGGMGPLGGGLVGAGLGGLAGYELGKMEGEREHRGFEPGSGFDAGGGGSSSPPDNGSFDAGGGGSSWDDSGSSGGGGSDFGGGGGGDSGGGGSDF
ncbi:MAG TPA: hypothetical protein VGL81_00785 [Polyangiaceae bacterium]|jgi:hypothetical protein